MACSEEFISTKVAVVDDLLLNAYGTVYKMAVKYSTIRKANYQLSPTEEMLSAKNIVSNLWSVLDYCCMILWYKYPDDDDDSTPSLAKFIKFPCDMRKELLDTTPEDKVAWEKERLESIAFKLTTVADYEKFKGAFTDIQYTNKNNVPDKVMTFYRLHYLRNVLTHRHINITGTYEPWIPKIYDCRSIYRYGQAAITISVPTEPWVETCEEKTPVPLVDFLIEACDVVKERRDKLFGTWGEVEFDENFEFNFTEKLLGIKLKHMKDFCNICHHTLHLECYGLEAEFKKQLHKLRSYEHYTT